MNKDKKFRKGDLVKFIEIQTSIDTLLPTGYLKYDHWSKFLPGEYVATKNDVGVIAVQCKRDQNITYARVMVNGCLYWFDVDNLEKFDIYST